MPRSAREKAEYAFLDSYAEMIERLLPTVRAVGFFDFRGEPRAWCHPRAALAHHHDQTPNDTLNRNCKQ